MSQIKRGTLISYITVFFNIISGLFFTPYILSKVGTGSYGTYVLVTTFLNYFLVDFGLGNTVAKFLSEFRARNNMKEANQFMSVVIKFFIMLALIILMILICIYPFLDSFFDGLLIYELELFKKMYIISGISSIILFLFIPLDGVLTSFELFTELKSIELLRKIFVIGFSVICLSIKSSVVLVVVSNVLAGFIVVAMKYIVVCKRTKLRIDWKFFDIGIAKKISSFSIWFTLIMMAQRFIIPFASTILGRFSNSSQISIFSIASTVEGYVYTIAACMNSMFLPMLTQLKVESKNEEINTLFSKVGRIQVYILGIIITALIIYGKEFIIIWVGEEFISAYYVILLIVPQAIIIYAQDIANSLIMIENKLKYKGICYVVGALLCTCISCLLAPNYGAIGVGIGIGICLWFCHIILMNFIYSKIIKLDIKDFFIKCYKRSIPLMIMFIIIFSCINQFFITKSILFLAIKIAIYSCFLFCSFWVLCMNKDEKKLFMNFVRRKY